jgi:lauroyl/myristoyl acyltransferase
LNASRSPTSAKDAVAARQDDTPRWTLHGLNNGFIFGLTCRIVGTMPRWMTYGIGRFSMWAAWRLMSATRAAVAANLHALSPEIAPAECERRALATFQAYGYDVIDFLRAIAATREEQQRLFSIVPEQLAIFQRLHGEGRGILLVTGHYGNWEAGSVLMRTLDLPLTIVAMAEASPELNRRRREMRAQLGADTIEVRQSLDTALQIRRRLGENGMIAMLMDRHFDRDRVPVTLAGRSAWFLKTPALMALFSGAPLLPCFIERSGPGRFVATIGEPIYASAELPRDEAIQRAAQAFADQLTVRLRAHPEFWYHFYRYWDAQTADERPA